MMQPDGFLSHRFTGAVPHGLLYEEKFLKLPQFLCPFRVGGRRGKQVCKGWGPTECILLCKTCFATRGRV